MSEDSATKSATRMYRVDRFTAPNASRSEFFASVRETHAFLKTLPGFVQDFILEREAGPESFNLLTIAEWESVQSFENAVKVMKEKHRKAGFVKEERWKRLGISADLGDYEQLRG